jgi:imidazolonepropionase-like amidohydrolase
MIVQVSGFPGWRREKISGRLRIRTEGALAGIGAGKHFHHGERGIRRERRRGINILLALLCVVAIAMFPARSKAKPGDTAAQQNGVVEQGKFVLHKFEQAIGAETYKVTREGDSLAVKVEFKFTDRGTPVPLNVTLKAAQDLTPSAFEIKGKTSRQSTIDETVEVQSEKVRVRDRDKWTEVARPQSYFTIAGYAPATMQMLMVRYWASHGSPAELATLPSGKVKIEPRGEDSVSIGGKEQRLKHYVIEGLVWGREALWFDAKNNLVAAVTFDAEFDHFEAVREGYESALGTFVGRAGADGMASLAEYAKGISGSRAEKLALIGGTLIDGNGSAAIADATVVIEKGRITAAGLRAQVKVPSGAKEIDARGKFILPGLWDMHAHFEQVEWGPVYLAAGATTVRDVGNEFEFITAVRDAVAAGRGLGPRLFLAGVVDGSGPLQLGVERVDTPEQARMWVHRYHDAGFQQMKIYSSAKLEELKAVTSEAHKLGMTVTGHVPEGIDTYQAIEAGQDQINHLQYVAAMMRDPSPKDASRADRLKANAGIDVNSEKAKSAIRFLLQHHTVLDPTLAIYEFFSASTARPPASFEPGVNKTAPELAAQLTDVGPPSPDTPLMERINAKNLEILGALHKAGVPIVAGTDQTVPGHSLYREIELYVQAGFTPMEAIQAATIVPARVMGVNQEVGTIEIGKRADVILLDANPLDSIRNIRSVKYVITDGTMYDCAELWRSVGFKP